MRVLESKDSGQAIFRMQLTDEELLAALDEVKAM